MGQALVSYMQRNSINDVPIIPPVIPEEPVDEQPGEFEDEEPIEEELSSEAPVEETAEEPVEEHTEEPVDAPEEEPSVEIPEDENIDEAILLTDETAPTEETSEDVPDAVVTEEVTEMLAQADELISHPTPEPVVAPEPVEVTLPEPEPEEIPEELPEEPEEAPEAPAEEPSQEPVDPESEEESSPVAVAAEPVEKPSKPKKKPTGLIAVLSIILAVLLLITGGLYFYENYYIQPINGIELQGENDRLTVLLDTAVDNSLLTVYCTDTYGNKLSQPVLNNAAVFTDLKPGSDYKIYVDISGFHGLTGATTTNYVTATQTNIVSFTAKTGDQDGSVNLSFSVQGTEATAWRVRYSAPEVTEKTADCSGNSVTVTGLELGKEYTFKLEPVEDLYVVGNDTLVYTATKVIRAENLTIGGYHNGRLLVTWDAPEGASVNSWTVRCYNTEGFDKTFTVADSEISIEGLDPAQTYTVKVTAEGMSAFVDRQIQSNSLTFKDLLLDDSIPGQLVVTWTYEGNAPADGWHPYYTIDGGDRVEIPCTQNTCVITPLLPGAHYTISFDLPENVTVYGGTKEYTVPAAPEFNDFGVSVEDFRFRMCHTPNKANWHWYSLMEADFTTDYAVGESASFVILVDQKPELTEANIDTLFVIRDTSGNVVSITQGASRDWSDMWSRYNGQYAAELDMPAMPQAAGSYTVDIYFAGAHVTTQNFTVS